MKNYDPLHLDEHNCVQVKVLIRVQFFLDPSSIDKHWGFWVIHVVSKPMEDPL